MCLFVETTALQGGSEYTLSWLLMNQREIPWEDLQRTPAASSGLPLMPRLAPATWVSAQLAYVRDLEQYNERAKKLRGAGASSEDKETKAKAKAEARAKGKAEAAERKRRAEQLGGGGQVAPSGTSPAGK